MKNFKVLIFLDLFRSLFTGLGADYETMRKILQAKLTIDSRRSSIMMGQTEKKESDRNQFILSMGIYLLMGLFLLPLILINQNIVFQMSMFFGVFIFMVMTSLISDFSSVLLDTNDKGIILSKPVSSKTLGLAKVVHITIYLLYISICLAGPSIIAGLIKHGFLFFLIFAVEIFFVNLLIVVMTALIYLVILKFFDGEKLRNVINYVQIGLSVAMAVGFQFLVRVFDIVDLKPVFTVEWWHYFIIPIWYAMPFELTKEGVLSSFGMVFTALAILVPIIAIILYVKLMPTFERSLLKLTQVSTNNKINKSTYMNFMSKIFCKKGEERIFFMFANDVLRNEKGFKLRVYPTLGLSIIFPFIMLFNVLSDISLNELPVTDLTYLYFAGIMIPSIVYMLKYSDNYKAAWLFKSLPIENDGIAKKGIVKAAVVRYLLPLFLLDAIIFTYLIGVEAIPGLMVVLLNFLIFVVISYLVIRKDFPFTHEYKTSTGDSIIMLFIVLALLALAIVHMIVNIGGIIAVSIYVLILLVINHFSWGFAFSK